MTASVPSETTATLDTLRGLLGSTLGLGNRAHTLNADSALLGGVPELDSMAVIEVVTQLELTFGITVHDDDISAETFATLGSLAAFVDARR